MRELPLDQSLDFEGATVAWGVIGDGPPIVLVHGTPFSAQVWRRIAPHLAGRRRVHYFDLLGYGRSAMGAGLDVSLGVQNRVLAALWREWGLAEADILAHDFGGATVLRAVLLDGLSPRTLTLVDPVALRPWGSPFVTHVRHHEAGFAGLPDAIHRAVLEAYIAGAASAPLRPDALETYVRPWLGETGKAGFYAQIAQMDTRYTEEVEARLSTIGCPTTVVWGEEDAWIPVEQGGRLAALLPDARLVTVPGAGHLVQEDAPEAIIAAVLERIG